MNRSLVMRSVLALCLGCLMASLSACTKTPEEVREWIRDRRCPAKMKEFIQNERFSLESKIEAIMVLTERGSCVDIPDALSEPLKTEEMNTIVAGAITRMNLLLEEKPEYDTKVKDAAYYLLKLDVNDENRIALLELIKRWLNTDNFFLPMEKAGRVEQGRLYEVLGMEALPIFLNAIKITLNRYDESLKKEIETEKEYLAKGKKYKILSRPSDKQTQVLTSTLDTLSALKLPTADDQIANIFIERIEATYPNIPRAYVLPFASNTSDLLLPIAKKILTDPNYKNETLNYFKDVMLATYFRKIQKQAGAEVCTTLLQSDQTGYIRWDCLEILTIHKGKDSVEPILLSLPTNYSALAIPQDHPQFIAQPSMTVWNSMRVYCTHLPAQLNNQLPLDTFRKLLEKGSIPTKILSIACLATIGEPQDIQHLESHARERTSIKEWGLQVNTIGELAHFNRLILDKRLKMIEDQQKKAAEKNDKNTNSNEPEQDSKNNTNLETPKQKDTK